MNDIMFIIIYLVISLLKAISISMLNPMPKTPKQATINFAGVFNVQTEKNKIIQVFFFEPFADSKPRINMSMPPLQKSLWKKNCKRSFIENNTIHKKIQIKCRF